MADGSTRSTPEVEGPPRTSLQASTAAASTPASMPLPNDSVDKEIYILQPRERILRQETAKLEAEERVLKARTQAAQATEAANEEDFFNEELPGEMSASLDAIRNHFGAVPDKYLEQIYHDKFDPKDIIRLSPVPTPWNHTG